MSITLILYTNRSWAHDDSFSIHEDEENEEEEEEDKEDEEDEEEGDDDDEVFKAQLTDEDLAAMRWVIVTERRAALLDEMAELVLGEQAHESFRMFNTSFSYTVLSEQGQDSAICHLRYTPVGACSLRKCLEARETAERPTDSFRPSLCVHQDGRRLGCLDA